jgi:hypothetical protein
METRTQHNPSRKATTVIEDPNLITSNAGRSTSAAMVSVCWQQPENETKIVSIHNTRKNT